MKSKTEQIKIRTDTELSKTPLSEFIGRNLRLYRRNKRKTSCWNPRIKNGKEYRCTDVEFMQDTGEAVLTVATGYKDYEYELIYPDEAGII